MAKTLRAILGGEVLSGVIRDPSNGISPDVLPPGFSRVTRRVVGNVAHYRKVAGNRQTARLVQYGSPSRRRMLKGVSEKTATLIHTFEHEMHEPLTLQNLMQMESEALQLQGQQEIDRQVVDFNAYFNNLRVAAIYSALALGAVYFDEEGNLLPSAAGAFTTVDFEIPAGNRNQLDWDGNGDIIAAVWSADGTDITGQVAALRLAAKKTTGYPIVHAFYGTNVPEYLFSNTILGNLISLGGDAYTTAAMKGMIPNGLLDLQWHPISECAWFEDQNGVMRDFVDANTVIFTPEPSADWWEFIEGSYIIPTDVGAISADASAALGNVQTVYGKFSYAKVLDDPVTIKHNAGDTFLAVPKVPRAIWIAVVHH